MELAALQGALPEIIATGATLVAISPQLPEHNREVVQRHGLTFELLTDAGNRVARAFGLVFTLPDELRRVYSLSGSRTMSFAGGRNWRRWRTAQATIHALTRVVSLVPSLA